MSNNPRALAATTVTRASERSALKRSFIAVGVAAAAIIAWDHAMRHDNDNNLPPKSPAPIHHANDNQRVLVGGPIGLSGAGRANFMTGPLPDSSTMQWVTISNGKRFQANAQSAPHFEGFLNALVAAGAPISTIGGYNRRHIAGSAHWSQHAYGNAIDTDQLGRNRVKAPFGAWARSHPDIIRAAARKYGIISGGDWHNPDFGHWEYGGSSGYQRPALGVVPSTGPQRKFAENVEDAIRQAAQSSGLDVGMLRAFTNIESGGNPNARTGRYHGLFQLSAAEFAAFGGKNIYDPYNNARIAAIKLKREADQFTRKFGRSPTPFDMYMVHQRGLAGYEQHLKSPDALAWTGLYNTTEGRQKGEGWARNTIIQNLPRAVLESMGGVERITNRQFIEWWRSRFKREAGRARQDDTPKSVAGGTADSTINSQPSQRAQALANVSAPELFTVRHNRRYHATVKLGAFERWATNEVITDKLRGLGFTEIEVKGSGSIREAQALWPGPDTTSLIDDHLTNVFELPDTPH